VYEPSSEDTEDHQARKRIGFSFGHPHEPIEDDGEQQQSEDRSQVPQLLSDDGKNEVGVLLRKKVEAFLCPLRKPVSSQPTAADSHHRLYDVVARAPGIDARIQEHQNAVLLIAGQRVPERSGDRTGRQVREDHRKRLHQKETVPIEV
ncbi:uncharacterized protein METZ01_LOCUS33834, partial [marine metagenome]